MPITTNRRLIADYILDITTLPNRRSSRGLRLNAKNDERERRSTHTCLFGIRPRPETKGLRKRFKRPPPRPIESLKSPENHRSHASDVSARGRSPSADFCVRFGESCLFFRSDADRRFSICGIDGEDGR